MGAQLQLRQVHGRESSSSHVGLSHGETLLLLRCKPLRLRGVSTTYCGALCLEEAAGRVQVAIACACLRVVPAYAGHLDVGACASWRMASSTVAANAEHGVQGC